MNRLRLILLVVLAFLWQPAPPSQSEDILSREGDESATTTDERRLALATLVEAAEGYRHAGEPLRAARLLNRAARLQIRLNLPHEAVATYHDALTVLSQAPDPPTRADSLNGLAEAYAYLDRCDEAQAQLRQAITLSEEAGYLAGKAEALLTLSGCQNYASPAVALQTARESLALWQFLELKRGIARAHAVIGYYQYALNNLAESANSHTEALNLWRELGAADRQADALIFLGYIEHRKGAWPSAFDFFTQAQGLINESDEPYKMGQIASGLAEAFIESGMPEIGFVKFRQALEYYRQSQNGRAMVATVWGIGRTQYALGNYKEALTNLHSALADAESSRDIKIVALCHDFLGRTYAAMGDSAAAERHFALAFDLYTDASNTMEAARVRALTARVYEQRGKVRDARGRYLRSLETFRALSDQVNESATLYALGSLELRQNNLDLAEDYLIQSIGITEDMRRVSTSRDLTAAFSASVHDRYEKYVECLMRKHGASPNRGFAALAFEVSERARARSLAQLLHATQARLAPGLDPELAEREKTLRLSLRVKEDDKVALLGTTYKKEELAALEDELSRLRAEYRLITEAIRERYPSYEQLARPAPWGLPAIQEQVFTDDRTVLLEYLLGTERSYAWAVTRDGLRSYELPARARIDEAVQRLYHAVSAPPGAAHDDEERAAAGELSRLVLSPVAAELDKERIIIVADGALNYVPFQVLPAPSGDGEPLIAGYEVVNAPSASVLCELRQKAGRRRPASKVLAAFGNPMFVSDNDGREAAGSDLSAAALGVDRWRHALRDIELQGEAFDPSAVRRLFYAGRELAYLVDAAAGGETFVAADYEATREQLLGTDLTRYSILHFATHGYLDTRHPENSGLLLSTVDRDGRARDGFVGLQNIYELRAPVDLVVLSACRTALGKDVRGEGLLGLTRGFMYAGASSVVASLWKVDDEATAELMRQFYANMLRRGMTPSAALREAQNSIRRHPDWRSPYYWAAFTLQGEYRQVIKSGPAVSGPPEYFKGAAAAGGTSLVLAAGVGWAFRRRRRRAA